MNVMEWSGRWRWMNPNRATVDGQVVDSCRRKSQGGVLLWNVSEG